MNKHLKTLLTLLCGSLFISPVLSQSDLAGISHLQSTYDRTVFLRSLYDSDREVRRFEDSVMLADGWRSPEHLAAISQLHGTDSLNTLKIDRYLDLYSYPEKEEFEGEDEARIAPWQILLHSRNREIRRKHFAAIYKAYEEGNLETRRLLLFLEDEYERSFGKNFQSYNQGERRIEELSKALKEQDVQKGRLRFP